MNEIFKVSYSSDMLWLYDSPHFKNARMKNTEKNYSKLRSNRKIIAKTGNFSLSFGLLEFALSQNSSDLSEKESHPYITNLQLNDQLRFYFILYVCVGGARCIKLQKMLISPKTEPVCVCTKAYEYSDFMYRVCLRHFINRWDLSE